MPSPSEWVFHPENDSLFGEAGHGNAVDLSEGGSLEKVRELLARQGGGIALPSERKVERTGSDAAIELTSAAEVVVGVSGGGGAESPGIGRLRKRT
jgi:hypothetical protein